MTRLLPCLALLAALAPALAQEEARTDPLEPLKRDVEQQDRLVGEGRAEVAVANARERTKDGTPESFYLLGRALGNAALQKVEAKQPAEARRLLEEARQTFEKSKEAGGFLYAPAHLGMARVARVRHDILVAESAGQPDEKARSSALQELDVAIEELRKALRLTKVFKAAAIELAENLWAKGLPGDAEHVLYQFLSARPNDNDARLLLGILKLQRKRFAEAEPEFRAVLSSDAGNTEARKLLAFDLMYQDKHQESAEHFELVRRADPKSDEPYMTLFHLYRRLGKKEQAVGVLKDLARELPGTEAARRAESLLEELAQNPAAWETTPANSPEALVKELRSPDSQVVLKALERMRDYRWPALPADVYRLLVKEAGTAPQRTAALRLIGQHGDPQTLTILEILLVHPVERERDLSARREAAHAISLLPTDAVVPVLFEVLDDPDRDVREWAVQGIASRTGKWFRADLAVPTADKDWPQELELYRKWWASSSASAAKRSAAAALSQVYSGVRTGSKVRIARYALPAMDDPVEVTWRAGYDLFRELTLQSFGGDRGQVAPEERARITRKSREWLETELRKN